MKKSFRGLSVLAGLATVLLASLGLAQDGFQPISHHGGHGAPVIVEGHGCDAPCPTAKQCVGKWETKKVTKYTYDCKCDDYCLPRCSLRGMFRHGHGCGSCDQEACGGCGECSPHVRTKRVLIKKPKVEEECVLKCIVEEVPCQVPCPVPCPPAAVPCPPGVIPAYPGALSPPVPHYPHAEPLPLPKGGK